MAVAHPEYLVPSVIALVLALYPLPWHLRTRNIATLTMIFWMTALNTVHTVNGVVWSEDATPRANAWGDISAMVIVAYNFALPTAHLVLAKQLESFTSLRPHSPLYDSSSRRRHRIFDIAVSIAAPVLGVLVHLSNMDRRFYVVQSFGPMPATYWDTWGVIWMAIVPILIAAACATYTIMALVNIHLRRQQMLSLVASDASVNREQFYRLMFLTIAELGTCSLRAIFNLISFQNGPQPLGHRGPPDHNLSLIESILRSEIKKSGMLGLNLSFFTVVACSITFFLCFATSTETKRFYSNLVHTILPCLPETHASRMHKLGSMDASTNAGGGASRSAGGHSHNQIGTYGTYASSGSGSAPLSPTTPKDVDISLEEMLGVPRMDKGAGAGGRAGGLAPSVRTQESRYDEEAEGALYLPPMETEAKV